MQPFTRDRLRSLPSVVNLMTAACALGIGRTKAYQLAQTGQFPCCVLRVGRSYHVPTTGLLELLGVTHLTDQTPTTPAKAESPIDRPATVTSSRHVQSHGQPIRCRL